MRMRRKRDQHIVRGVLAGVAGGLVASWLMNLYVEGPGAKLQSMLETDEEKAQEKQQEDEPKQDATMKAADAVVHSVTGGQHLSLEGRQKGGPIVHYTFGALMGGLYGGLAEYADAATTGYGSVFGTALFAGADMVLVPAAGLSGSPAGQPMKFLAAPWSAHVVYGMVTEAVRRLVRPIF